VYRLPHVHERLPLLGASFQLDHAGGAGGRNQSGHTLSRQSAKGQGSDREVPFLYAENPQGLDPDSEIRYVLENKSVFRLKEELGTEPKFWYFAD